VQNPPLTKDVWELYHVSEDFSEAHDLAAKNPAKLKEMQDLFMKEAVRNHVLPIDDRRSERFNPALATARPHGHTHDVDGVSGDGGDDGERLP
jgi:arylsulfatase